MGGELIPAEIDVLVAGYGPVGAAVACLLGLYGVRTLVIDKADGIHMEPRAIALDNEALRILQMAGLTDAAFEKVVIPHVHLRSRHVGLFGTINMKGKIDGHPKLVTFYQPNLERALRRTAEAYPCVTALGGIELLQFKEENARIVAELRGSGGERHWVTSKFLIGADGARSLVRKGIGQEFIGSTYTEDWLIVDAKNVPNNIDHIEFICNSRHPSPHMPAPGGRTRWEFMLAPGESSEQITDDDSIKRLLAPWGPVDVIQIERKAVYRFAGRSCKCYSKGRVFLAGDAAHVTPPFAGQGLVSGLRDAANLSWKIAWVIQGKADPSILETYDQERRPHALKMIALAKGLGQAIMPRNVFKAVLIQGALKSLRLIRPVRKFLEDFGLKPNNQFDEGLFVRGPGRLRRGGLMPQFGVRTPAGSIDLSDNLLGPHLTLVGLGADAGARLSAASRRAWCDHGGKIVALRLPGSSASDLESACDVMDDDERISKDAWAAGWCAVVRPDRIVLHDGPVASAEQLVVQTLGVLNRRGSCPPTASYEGGRKTMRNADERIAVISGGSSGIGREFVLELHRRGYRVLFCGRDEEKLRALEAQCPGIRGFRCDVTDKASVLRFASAVLEEYGSVDLVISNAGGSREIDFNTLDAAGTDLTVEIRGNLEGAINLIAAFLPALRMGAPSTLVVVTSGYALAPATRAPLYSASKAGLRSFTKALRRQLAGSGILVTEVAPPVVDTPSVAHRNVPKMLAERLVRQTLTAVERGKTEVYPGAVRWLPLLLRLAPGWAERIVGAT